MHLAQRSRPLPPLMSADRAPARPRFSSICTKKESPAIPDLPFSFFEFPRAEKKKRAGGARLPWQRPRAFFLPLFVRLDQADDVGSQAHAFCLCLCFVFGKFSFFHPKADLFQVFLLVFLRGFISCLVISFVLAHVITPYADYSAQCVFCQSPIF